MALLNNWLVKGFKQLYKYWILYIIWIVTRFFTNFDGLKAVRKYWRAFGVGKVEQDPLRALVPTLPRILFRALKIFALTEWKSYCSVFLVIIVKPRYFISVFHFTCSWLITRKDTSVLKRAPTLIHDDLDAFTHISILQNSSAQISNIFCKSEMEIDISIRSSAYMKALKLVYLIWQPSFE